MPLVTVNTHLKNTVIIASVGILQCGVRMCLALYVLCHLNKFSSELATTFQQMHIQDFTHDHDVKNSETSFEDNLTKWTVICSSDRRQ